jgi:hypothetical protein
MTGFLHWDQWRCAHAVFVRLQFVEKNEKVEHYRATSRRPEKCREASRKENSHENEILDGNLVSFATLGIRFRPKRAGVVPALVGHCRPYFAPFCVSFCLDHTS